jgi:hypothetical protein
MIDPIALQRARNMTRRHFLNRTGALGIGAMALGQLFSSDASANVINPDKTNPLSPRSSPAPARAKRVIFLHMSGGPPTSTCLTISPSW